MQRVWSTAPYCSFTLWSLYFISQAKPHHAYHFSGYLALIRRGGDELSSCLLLLRAFGLVVGSVHMYTGSRLKSQD